MDLEIAKPILFNTEMVQAILDDRKTVTRRIIKPQPKAKIAYCCDGSNCGKWGYPSEDVYKIWGDEFKRSEKLSKEEEIKIWTSPCHTNDILYVRETWCKGHINNSQDQYFYKADDNFMFPCKWRPSIHMPKEAARIFLRVTDVRVERLQEIMEDPPGPNNQVVKEGCTYGGDFITVWDRTIKKSDYNKYGWYANPWVWVIEFERMEIEE